VLRAAENPVEDRGGRLSLLVVIGVVLLALAL
jgi:hypothetical protein